MMHRVGLSGYMGLALAAYSCATPAAIRPQVIQLPSYAYSLAQRGTPLTQGTLVGKVAALGPDDVWRGRKGVPVMLEEHKLASVTDAGGYFGFQDLPSGEYHLRVSESGYAPLTLVCAINPVAGLSRVNLPLVPETGHQSHSAQNLLIGGVATDPRGAALANAKIRLVDSASRDGAGSNLELESSTDGFFQASLTDFSPRITSRGTLMVTTSGRTPGGLRCESDEILQLSLPPLSSLPVVASTNVVESIRHTTIDRSNNSRLQVAITPLPQRRDELVLAFVDNNQKAWRLPEKLENGKLTCQMPDGLLASASVEILPLGIRPITPTTFSLKTHATP